MYTCARIHAQQQLSLALFPTKVSTAPSFSNCCCVSCPVELLPPVLIGSPLAWPTENGSGEVSPVGSPLSPSGPPSMIAGFVVRTINLAAVEGPWPWPINAKIVSHKADASIFVKTQANSSMIAVGHRRVLWRHSHSANACFTKRKESALCSC